jgi:photosystem II stability/assembly factor-like uncharacterized protein
MAGVETLFIGTSEGLAVFQQGRAGEWREARRALDGRAVTALLALDAETVLVAVAGGVPQQSFDGGHTWSEAPGAPVEPVGLRVATAGGPVSLLNPRLMGATAYALLGGRPQVLLGAGAGGALLFLSYDDGIHWEPAAAPVTGRVTTIIPSARAGVAWAATDAGQLLRTDDRGVSWREAARLDAAIVCLAGG